MPPTPIVGHRTLGYAPHRDHGRAQSKVDRVWDAFWSGGISNPLEVIEQITYLLFIRRLDQSQLLAERRARVSGKLANPVFRPDQRHLRWGEFKNDDPEVMFDVVGRLRLLAVGGLTAAGLPVILVFPALAPPDGIDDQTTDRLRLLLIRIETPTAASAVSWPG